MWSKHNLMNIFAKEHNVLSFSYIDYNDSNINKQLCLCYNIHDSTDLSFCIPDLIIYDIPNMNIDYNNVSLKQFDNFKTQYINYGNNIMYSTPKACWFGNLYLYHSENAASRIQQLIKLTDQHTILISCNNIVQSNMDDFRYNILAADFTIEYMMSFKYFIYINTDIFSGILKWLLMSNRPVLLVESQIGEYYLNELIPYKHYIPVNHDLSNLIQQIELLNSDSSLCENIAKNAFEFINKEFNHSNILSRITNCNRHIHADVNYKSINQIYLTFDDGPQPVFTPDLLDILSEYNAKCTFFVLGTCVEQYPDVIKRMHLDGHTIGIHGWNHDAITTKDDSTLEREIAATANLIYTITNKYPTLYRPPYGQINADNVRLLKTKLNLTIVMGDIDSGDYSGTVNENQIINNVLSQVYSNSIIVFHDSSQITVNAITKLLSLIQQYDVAAM